MLPAPQKTQLLKTEYISLVSDNSTSTQLVVGIRMGVARLITVGFIFPLHNFVIFFFLSQSKSCNEASCDIITPITPAHILRTYGKSLENIGVVGSF